MSSDESSSRTDSQVWAEDEPQILRANLSPAPEAVRELRSNGKKWRANVIYNMENIILIVHV